MIDPGILLSAYAAGYFPMADEKDGQIQWYSPDPRAILPLGGFRISRSLRQRLQHGTFTLSCNSRFEEVIRGCAARDETWISGEIIRSYVRLHQLGYAHSVEAWSGGNLAGGLYGVALGGAFFGESMFTTMPDASKVALVHLVSILTGAGFTLLDIQMMTPHLERFGAIDIPRDEYLRLLRDALNVPARFPGDC